MAVVTATGDKVLWHALERVDLDDLDAMQTLALEAVADAVGGVYGSNGGSAFPFGLLSRLRYNGSNPAAVTIEPFKAVYVAPGADTYTPGKAATFTWERVTAFGLAHNESLSGSGGTLDFTGRAGTYPYLWARRDQAETDDANRRFWDDVGETEVVDSVSTRVRSRTLIGLSPIGATDDPPNDDAGWVIVGRATSVGSAVVIKPRYALERYDYLLEAEVSLAADDIVGRVKYYSEDRSSDGPGLIDLHTAFAAAVTKLVDGRWVINADTFKLGALPGTDYRGWRQFLADGTFKGLYQLQQSIATLSAAAGWRAYSWLAAIEEVGDTDGYSTFISLVGGGSTRHVQRTDGDAGHIGIVREIPVAVGARVDGFRFRYRTTQAWDGTVDYRYVALVHVAAGGTVTSLGSGNMVLASTQSDPTLVVATLSSNPVIAEGDTLYAICYIAAQADGSAVGEVRLCTAEVNTVVP